MKRTSWLAGFLLVVCGLVAGCSGLGTAPASAPPVRTEAPKPAVLSAAEAKPILVKWYHTPAPDGLELTTGRQREFHEAIERERQAGRTHTALPYWIDEQSDIAVVEGNGQYAIVQLHYENSFNRHDETVRFRLENVGDRWLVANHTDDRGIWWPDYLAAGDQAPASPPQGPAKEPIPAAPPTSAPGARDQGAPGQSSTQTGSQLTPTGIVQLIPYTGAVGFKMLVPEGWKAQPTALGDLVQFSNGQVQILVQTWQRRGAPMPYTADEIKRHRTKLGTSEAELSQVQLIGAVSAFEITSRDDGGITQLQLHMIGSTWQELLWFRVPANLYPQWEPVFRQIIRSFEPTNLNAEEMPGRP